MGLLTRVANLRVDLMVNKVSGTWQDCRVNRSKVILQTGFRGCVPIMWGARMSQNHPLGDQHGDSCLNPGTWEVESRRSRVQGQPGIHELQSQKTKTILPIVGHPVYPWM